MDIFPKEILFEIFIRLGYGGNLKNVLRTCKKFLRFRHEEILWKSYVSPEERIEGTSYEDNCNLSLMNISLDLEIEVNFGSLEELDLNYSRLGIIPKCVYVLTQLTSLSLNHNYLTEIPSELTRLISLKKLRCCGNYITHIPEFTTMLDNLYLEENDIEKIDGNPKNYLNLGRQDNFSDNLLLFFSQHQPKKINLSSCGIRKITNRFSILSNVRELSLRNNFIRNVPECVTCLMSLEVLNLSCNVIKIIPQYLTKLTNLRELFLCSNRIRSIPPLQTSLECLTLGENKIIEIADYDFYYSLRRLDLGNNYIVSMPQGVKEKLGRALSLY